MAWLARRGGLGGGCSAAWLPAGSTAALLVAAVVVAVVVVVTAATVEIEGMGAAVVVEGGGMRDAIATSRAASPAKLANCCVISYSKSVAVSAAFAVFHSSKASKTGKKHPGPLRMGRGRRGDTGSRRRRLCWWLGCTRGRTCRHTCHSLLLFYLSFLQRSKPLCLLRIRCLLRSHCLCARSNIK